MIAAALLLMGGIERAGIWDPHELDRAELARRIAVARFDAPLALEGAQNEMPTLSDLGAGELGFTSMAVGFKALGLNAAAGRLPLAFWCLAGVLVVFAFMARSVSPRAGMFSGLALASMPAYFVQARTMLGDAVTMAAFAMCFFGFAGALSERRRLPAVAFGLVGLVGALSGFLSRGWLIGVAAPCAGVGLGWLALLGTGQPRHRSTQQVAVGGACLVGGGAAAYLGALPIWQHGHALREVPRALGVSVQFGTAPDSTFDLMLRDIGHAFFPWSALLPLAFGLVVASRTHRSVRTLLPVGAAVAYLVHAALAPFAGALAFCGAALLAAVVGLAMAELDEHSPRPIVGVAAVVLLGLLCRDVLNEPDRLLAAYAVPGAEIASGIAVELKTSLVLAAAVFGAGALLAWCALDPDHTSDSVSSRLRRLMAHYEALVQSLSRVWKGNLAFGFLVLEAALLGMGATLLIGRRLLWPSVVGMSRSVAYVGLNLWWAVPLGLVTVPLSIDVARRAASWVLERMGVPRSFGMLVACLVGGAVMCFGVYGTTAERLSPKGALEHYAATHRAGEPLGLLGVSARLGSYYARGERTEALQSVGVASKWLAHPDEASSESSTRWLAFRAAQLAELNAAHREKRGSNLHVVGDAHGQILLSRCCGDTTTPNVNPLSPWVSSAPPSQVQHSVMASFGDQLRVLGWEVHDEAGTPVSAVTVGQTYRMRLHLHVQRRIARSFRAFLHIDGAGRRHNGDHAVLEGLYPTNYWREGDYIVDEHTFALERHFTPGRYAVFFGFFIFKERMPVTEGQHREDRLYAGMLEVH